MNSNEIRKRFLEFFKSRGHAIVPSSSLIPDDPTTLFTSAGMQPMVPYLLGQKHPDGSRIVNSQRCFRTQDIEEVGDNRHDTFFEMLGNWSFGDYFKKEQLAWMFEFLTEELKLDPHKLFVSVFEGDESIPRDAESAALWKELFSSVGIDAKDVENSEEKGMQGGRIFYYGEKKNWWSRSGVPSQMPAGELGGPDSEMFYEFSEVEHDPTFGPHCHVNCDCGHYLEIGNNVFMEYIKNADGTFAQLPAKNVDFGGGLERLTAATRNDPDIFKTDLFYAFMHLMGDGFPERSKRIVADHARGAVFLIADGVMPGNKERGYVLRRLIRRAIPHLQELQPLEMIPAGERPHQLVTFQSVAECVIDEYGKVEQYTYLLGQRDEILRVIKEETILFTQTYGPGKKKLEGFIRQAREQGSYKILGNDIFLLVSSYGFTREWIADLAKLYAIELDLEGYEQAFKQHQEISRAGAEKKFGGHGLLLDTGELKAGNEEELKKVTRLHTATHLLQAALRKVLGEGVRQMGSDITAERTRFDFSFPRKLTPEELADVQEIVNEAVVRGYIVECKKMPYEEAAKSGALHFFKEKYPAEVNVYSVVDRKTGEVFSRELCGGPHVARTGEIGTFKILKEEASAAGVRRIRATVN